MSLLQRLGSLWKRHPCDDDDLPDLVHLNQAPGSAEALQALLRESLPMLMREADRAEAEAIAGAETPDAEVLAFYSAMSTNIVCRVRHALGLPANFKYHPK